MKSNRKLNLIFLILIFAYLPSNFNNTSNMIDTNKSLVYNDDFASNIDILQPSKISGKIHIDNNWTAARDNGICYGNGTYSEPYVIEDLEINSGGSGTCILIENSNVYFKIENCTLTAGYPYPNAGIQLKNVIEGELVINYCTFSAFGLYLENCNNITISGNNANNNGYGIKLDNSNNNNISENTASNNSYWGIDLHLNCNDNIISGNIINNNSIGIYLALCHNDIISGNTANNNNRGIELSSSHFNIISENTANNNDRGIRLVDSDFNTVSGNTLIGNDECISEEGCQGNSFSNNGDCTYGQVSTPLISGYSSIFLISILSIIAVIIYIEKKNFEIKDNCI